jgi:PKD repeat protein
VVVCESTTTSSDIVATRISPAGLVIDPPNRAVVRATYYLRFNLKLVYAASVFLLTFDDSGTKGVRFDSNLNLLDAAPIQINDSGIAGIAANPTGFYIVWNRQNPDYSVVLAGSRLSTAGVKLDGTNGVSISGSKQPYAYDPSAVTWDGVNWRATWGDYTNLWVARINSSGTVLDTGSVKVVGPRPGLSAGNGAGGIHLVWASSTNSNNDTYTANIAANNAGGPNRCLSTGAPLQIKPDLATSGNGYMLVYRSAVSANARVLAQPLDENGSALTAEPVQLDIGASANGPGTPNVAWSSVSSLYLVAWGRSNGVAMQRLSATGVKIDPAPVIVRSNHFGSADVAAIGDTFLITTRKYGYTPQYIDAYGTRVRGSDGAVLDTLLLGGGYVSSPPAVTTLGGRFYAAFHSNWSHDNSGASMVGVLVPPTGTNLTSSGLNIFSTAGGNGIFEVGLASSGDTALLAQSQELTSGVENDLLCFIIQTNGTASPMINLTPWIGNQYRPRVAWDGSNFVLTYQDQRNRLAPGTLDQLDARSDIFAMRVSRTGAILDPQGFLLSALPIGETDPTVISQSGVSLFAWAQMFNDPTFANYRIVTTRLDASANKWPVAVANLSTNEGNVPLTVNFSSAGSSDPDGTVIAYFWEFGDGTSSTAANPAHTFTTPGNYVLRLTVTDNLGATATQTALVKAMLPNQIPVAIARAVPQSGPAPLNVTLYADGSYDPDGPIGNIEWLADEGGTYWGATAYYTFTSNGIHAVTLRVYDSRGEIGTTNILVNVGGPNMKPVAVASASPAQGPAPLWVYFTGSGSYDTDGNIVSYAWTFGDGGTADYASPTHYYANAGTYTANLVVTDNAGGKGTNTVTIWVGASNRPPVAVVSANPTKGNAPLTVSFSSVGSSDPDGLIASYAWTFGDGATSTAASPAHTYLNRGAYTARLTVTDDLGATATASAAITVRRPPQLANARVATPGTFSFSLEGETNATYILQSSPDGRNWTNVMTLPSPDMPAALTLPIGPDKPMLLWRAVMQ